MDEWRSCLFQIIMTLIVYQKVFKFTHNDLHTNNIMYVKMERNMYVTNIKISIIKYQHMEKYIIIDFGRAIYYIAIKYFVVIVFIQRAMQILNIILNHILMIRNLD